jgi:DNA processing protein
MDQASVLHQIAITRIPHVGNILVKTLISYCGGIEEVFRARKKELLKIPGIGETVADSVVQNDTFAEAEKELTFIEKHQIKVFFYLDKNYPQRLRQLPDSPPILYFKGNANLDHERTIGIVGTRQPTPHGVAICEEIVDGLKGYNVLTISGLAYGIDVTAHRKSLECGIPTIGVMGNGFRQIYPATHRSVAEKMLQSGGLLTEFAHYVRPDRENFPMRNRIIAGLSDAVIVVETATSGGSIITAQLANDYNKDVFAVPGRVKDKFSQGCNQLIKSNRAALLESAADVAYVMGWNGGNSTKSRQASLFVELSDTEQKVVDLLRQEEVIGIDQLMYLSQLSNSALAALLLELEFKGVVKSLPGKQYMLI